ncbi:MAG: outer membrane protein transport protein [Candidatus Hydrogenedentes bacterium]|nr:outer membrane protein transport protein [Candidatus Hydrogenedentota bacterium]
MIGIRSSNSARRRARTCSAGGTKASSRSALLTSVTKRGRPAPWTLRAGLAHGNSAIPDEFIFANALTPALGENHLGLGFTYAVNANLEYSFAYRHCFREEQADNGRGDIFSKLGRGSKANYEENGFIVQYSYKW